MPEVHDSPNPWVAYAAYRTRTMREIPEVLLEPVGQRPPGNAAQSTSSLRPST